MILSNPVLPGSHPDPSVVRVGGDLFLATSTFEWFPGIRLHHGRDLAHWRTVGHALTRHVRSVIETSIEFEPESFQEAAGLVLLYDTRDLIYLNVTHDEHDGKCIAVTHLEGGHFQPGGARAPLPRGARVHLRATLDGRHITLSFRLEGDAWRPLGGCYDLAQLSDECGGKDGFTGAFVGLAAQDTAAHARATDFDYFTYEGERDGDRS